MVRCPVYAGSDPCLLVAGHDGKHRTLWADGRVVMCWRGDEPWSHTVRGADYRTDP